MVLKKSGKPVLKVDARPEMIANRPDGAFLQPVVKSLAVTVVKALLLQDPFEIPVHLGHEGATGIYLVHRCRRLRPERRWGDPPGALKNLWQ